MGSRGSQVLFFAVDDLRPDINAFGGPDAVPGTFTPKMCAHGTGSASNRTKMVLAVLATGLGWC